jgi:K+-sensing histidine kinase KdpD
MKNTFLDAVSHQLRTPLATVIGIALTRKRAGSSLAEEETVDLVDRLVANADGWTGSWATCWTWTG